jgi:hypothetical protein
MATTSINTTRQSVLSADREFNFSDFTSGEAKPLIYVRPGTRILRGWVDITTAWNSGSTCTYTVGDTEGTDDVDRWLTSTNAKSAALTALLAPLKDSVIDTPEAVTMTVTSAGTAPTAGAGALHIEFIEEERSTELYTYRG